MKKKIFISYTLKDGVLNMDFFCNLKSFFKGNFLSYIDIIDNDSKDKQARVEEELLNSDYLVIIKTHKTFKSEWVKKEILIAQNNCIPIFEFDYKELIEYKFQPITLCISNAGFNA